MKRNNRYDVYKCLLILGVIWGHAITALKSGSEGDVWIHTFIRTYDMPMFAFITGVFLKKSMDKHSLAVNVLNKLGTILFPILLWNLIYNVINRAPLTTIGRFWYLWSIVICTFLILLIGQPLKKWKVLQCISLLVVCVVLHLGLVPFFDSVNVGFLFLPCVVGCYYEEIEAKVREKLASHMMWVHLFLGALFVLLLCFWNTDYNVWNTGCNVLASGNPVRTGLKMCYRAILGVTGSIVMKMIFDLGYGLLDKSIDGKKMIDIMLYPGKATLQIYILQSMIVEYYGAKIVTMIVSKLGWNPFIMNLKFLGWFEAPAVAIVSVALCWGIAYGLQKIPLIKSFIWGFSSGSLIEKR